MSTQNEYHMWLATILLAFCLILIRFCANCKEFHLSEDIHVWYIHDKYSHCATYLCLKIKNIFRGNSWYVLEIAKVSEENTSVPKESPQCK